MQETHFIASNHEDVLVRKFHLFSAYFDCHYLRGASWLANCSLSMTCSLLFADTPSSVLNVTLKKKVFQLIGVYAPNNSKEHLPFWLDI